MTAAEVDALCAVLARETIYRREQLRGYVIRGLLFKQNEEQLRELLKTCRGDVSLAYATLGLMSI